jgi:PAS domain-containing protein
MPAHQIEVILARQLADSLTVPIFLTDAKGTLLFYNEPAQELLGKRFEETGPMPLDTWSTIFNPEDGKGQPISPKDLPLVRSLASKEPAQGNFWIRSLNSERFHLSVTCVPLIGEGNRFVGALAIFWKIS